MRHYRSAPDRDPIRHSSICNRHCILVRRMSNTAALIALGLIAGAMVLVASSTPDEAALRRMSARFAPVEIAADINSLPAGEKRALAKLVEASRLMDALFLRQVWAGNESLFMELVAARVERRSGGACQTRLLPDQQGSLVAARSQPGVRRWCAREAGSRQLLSRRRNQGRNRTVGRDLASGRKRTRDRFLHHDPADAAGLSAAVRHRAVQPRVSRRAGTCRVSSARGGCGDRGRVIEALSRIAREGVSLQRLLRERSRLDGARFHHRTHDRSVRGVRGRVVQSEGRVRSVHHGERPGRV